MCDRGGTHQLKPIEIYKGRPIFYSLGNFIFQSPLIEELPSDFWEKYDYSKDMTVKEALDIKSKGNTIGLQMDINNYLSIIPEITFDEEKLIGIRMLPIELNFNARGDLKGLPNVADEKQAMIIVEQLNKISKIYLGEGKCYIDDNKYIRIPCGAL